MGKLIGIARATKVRADMEELVRVDVTEDLGVEGDRRGAVKGAQVTILAREDWDAACAEVGEDLPWITRRANLFVEGVDLPQEAGVQMRVGEVLLEVRQETDPCSQMDAAKDGLRAALTPDWRGGVRCDVIEGGMIARGVDVQVMKAD